MRPMAASYRRRSVATPSAVRPGGRPRPLGLTFCMNMFTYNNESARCRNPGRSGRASGLGGRLFGEVAMRVMIAGGSGQVGSVLARAFQRDGQDVVVLSR